MVDIVVRATKDENENYTLSFKTNEVIFGGGRLAAQADEINNSYDALIHVYDEANKAYEQMVGEVKPNAAPAKPAAKPKTETADVKPEKTMETPETPAEEKKEYKRKARKKDLTDEEIKQAIIDGDFKTLAETMPVPEESEPEQPAEEPAAEPEAPKRRRRKKTA
jgi:hypothetical protein